jgi:hypothetical protein
MRRLWLLLGLCACSELPRPVAYARYRPEVASERWCPVDAGVFAFVSQPQVAPSLIGHGCMAPRPPAPPAMAPAGSTFAELVVEPGGAIEIPVQLPQALQGAGCRIDTVVIPHGKRSADLAIEIAIAGRMLPIVAYEQLPAPPEDGGAPRAVVSDGSDRPRAIWAPDAPPGERSTTVTADPALWPTGAVLRFDGARTADGAASVAFEIEPEPEAPSGAPSTDTPDAPATPATPAAAPTPPPIRQPAPLELVAYRHRIDVAAPDSFAIVLRARERAFGIGVRSDRESADPRLLYRAPGDAESTPTRLVPQVAIVLSRCGRPVEEVLRDLR